MLKLVIFLFFILELKKAVDAAAYILPPQEKPAKYAHLEGCYVPELDRVLPYDKPYSPCDGKSCMQYTCNRDGNTYVYFTFTLLPYCGVIAAGEGCWVVPGNKYLPYDKCCDTVKCKKRPPVDTPDVTTGIDEDPSI